MKNTNYLISLVLMVIGTIVATVIIHSMRPDHDNTVLITLVLAFSTQVMLQILSLMKTQETHVLVNSEMEKFRDALKLAAIGKVDIARRDGVDFGRDQEQQRTQNVPPRVAPVQVIAEQVVAHQTVEKKSEKPGGK